MNVFSNDYILFMEDSYNEAYDEMIKWNEEHQQQVLEEKSHGNLKFDYRQVVSAKDYPDRGIKQGDRLLCVYDLKGAQITYPGHSWDIDGFTGISDKDQDNEELNKDNAEVQKNIRKKGNTDHQSYGQRLITVKDLKTGKQWNAYKHVDTNLRKNLEKSKDFGMEFEVKGHFRSSQKAPTFKIKLGEVETSENRTFKSTKNFTNIYTGNKYDMNRLSDHEGNYKYFRGIEKDNIKNLPDLGNLMKIAKANGYKGEIDKNDIKYYFQTLTSITIPNTINTILNGTFDGCFNLQSITIPNSVTKIGNMAFVGCKSLKSINIPASVTTIGEDAFFECKNLTSITIPASVTTIGDGAFSSCYSLKSVFIPNSVTIIDEAAFSNCNNLKDVKILGKPRIADGAFYLCNNLSEESKKRIRELQPKAVFESTEDEFDENIDLLMETMEWILEANTAKKDESNSIYKINYYFRDNLQFKYVTPVLQKARNRNLIIDFTAKFMDDHSQALSAPGPIYSFTFGKKETEFLYELFGISSDKILELYKNMVNETYYGKISLFITGFVKNAPHKLLITAILIDALQNDYDDIVEACEYLWAFSEYPIIFNDYWRIGVNEEVMRHTIEHLPGKFKIVTKKLDTLLKLIKYDSNSAVSQYREAMKKIGDDHLYIELIRRMRNQLNSTLKNISRLYYNNVNANNTQHQSVSEFDDGTIADQDGVNTNINQAVEKTVSKFISGDINSSIVRIVAEYSQIDKSNLTGYLTQIFATKNNKISKFIENIIILYFTKNPANTSLDSSEFINFGLALYRSIGTSKDSLIAEIKQILNFWMNDIINIRDTYSREATIINYTRGIFNYFIMMIKYYN